MVLTASARAGTADPPATDRSTPPRPPVLAGAVGALAVAIASAAALGPLVLGLMRYRTSPTTLNQLLGSDAAALFVIAPLAVFAALLARRGHPAGAPLATGIGAFALYTYAQVIVGQEYLRLPGNVERFFPLLLAVFLLAGGTVVLGWRATPIRPPALSPRLERCTGWVLLLLAAFLVFGLHLRSMLTAWSDPAAMTEYVSSPTPFWLVKLMDLGIVVPVAVAAGIGLLRHAGWARRVTYPLLTGYSCLGLSVATMGLVMNLNGDPDASPALAAGFGAFAAAFVVLTGLLYRPLFHRPDRPDGGGPGLVGF